MVRKNRRYERSTCERGEDRPAEIESGAGIKAFVVSVSERRP